MKKLITAIAILLAVSCNNNESLHTPVQTHTLYVFSDSTISQAENPNKTLLWTVSVYSDSTGRAR